MNKFDLYLKTDKNNCINFLFKTLECDYENSNYLEKLSSLITADGMDKVKDWSKLISILIKVNDLNACKRLLKITKKMLTKKNVSDLLKKFGWDQLKDELNLMPVTLANVVENCGLVNVRLI